MALAHYWYAGVLSAAGRHEQAIASIQRAQELDPLSPLINADAGWYYFYARRYDESVRECKRALEIDPNFGFALNCIMAAHREQGKYDAALGDARELFKLRAAQANQEAEEIVAADAQHGLHRAAELWLVKARSSGKARIYITVSNCCTPCVAQPKRPSVRRSETRTRSARYATGFARSRSAT